MDNTWATPLYFRPLDHGVDLVDPGRHQIYRRPFRRHARHRIGQRGNRARRSRPPCGYTGLCEGPDDIYLGLRGLRTLGVRLERHYESGLAVARWLETRPEVLRLLHPALPSHPGHAIWKRDFTGASGLFSMVLKPVPQKAVLRLHRHARTVRHRRLVGRLREPRHSVRLHAATHRDALGARRTDGALSYRPGGGRRSHCRSRARLCRARRGGGHVARKSRRCVAPAAAFASSIANGERGKRPRPASVLVPTRSGVARSARAER